jgi:tetratricopeptide (TPR) repeat protein
MSNRIEVLEQFVAQDPSDAFSRYALALELVKVGRESDAAIEFNEVISRDSGYVAAYYQLGRLLAQSEDTNAARDVYSRGLVAAKAAGDQRALSELQEALDALD